MATSQNDIAQRVPAGIVCSSFRSFVYLSVCLVLQSLIPQAVGQSVSWEVNEATKTRHHSLHQKQHCHIVHNRFNTIVFFFHIRYNIVNIRVKKANLLLLLFTSEATFSTEQHYSRFTQATRTSAILFLQSKLCELLKTPVQKNKKHLLESTAHLCTPCLLLVLYLQRWPGWPLTFQTTQVQTEAESLFKHYSESCLRSM